MRNGKSFIKRMITGILSAAMILTAVPTYAYAAEETDETKIIEPDLSYVEIVEDETIKEESSIGADEDYSNEENSQVNNVEENTNSNDSNDNEERGAVLANDEKQLNDEDDLSDELLSDPAESYEVSNNSGDFTVEYKDGTEEKNGKHYVSSNTKSIKISVKANTGKGIKTVTATIGGVKAVVKKQGKGNFCNNGDGEYLITVDEDGNTAINGDVEINVESDTVYTVTFVDANKNSIGVTPIPNLEEGPAAFIPNVNWDGTVKVFKGASLVFEYNVPDREYVITKVTQGENGDVLECFKTMHHEWENPCTGFHYKTSEINNDTSIYMYSDSFCTDGKVELTIVKSGFTSVVWKDDTIGTGKCSLKLYRKGDTGNSLVDFWNYSFTNSEPDTPLWIFVSEDKKSWESRWTYKKIIGQSGTYYATLEIKDKTGYNGKVYKSNEFEYTDPTSKIDTPSNFRTETREEGEFAGDRYLYWNDVLDSGCAGYEYEVVNTSESNKSVNCWLKYGGPNEQNEHNLDNYYNFLGQGVWTISVRALSDDINSKNVSDWAVYTYSMENSINCGYEDEENGKYYSIRPAYDYSYRLTQEEYSNIIDKSGWQESENKYVERYIVKPGAQKVIVTISSRDKYIDPANVTAKIGGKDADVSHKTNKYGTYEYTIKKSDNTAIDRDIVINPGEFVGVRTITFSVDNDDAVSRLCDIDMYNPSKDLKKKCVVQRVGNKITFSNIPVNEDFKFKAPIARGYKISLIKSGEKDLSQSSGVYTIPKGADDVNAVITTVSSGAYSIPVTPGNATVTWGNDSEANNNLSSNKINTDYKKDVYLKVVRNKGYSIDGVTMKVNGNSDDTVLTTVDNSEGDIRLFKLFEKDVAGDNNFRIATGAAITVKTTAKAAAKVTTSIKHDGVDSTDKLTISGGANVGSGDSAYYGATNKDIVLTYTLPDNKVMGDAKVTIGGDTPITADENNNSFKLTVNKSVYKWTLSKNVVEDAWDNGKNIHFDIATSSKKVNLSVAGGSSDKVGIYKYTKGTGYNSESDLIEKSSPLEIPYMAETYLYVAVDPDAVIKSVKAGSTVLKTGTETIGYQQYVYYIVPAASLKDDVAITVETEAMVAFKPIYSNCSIVVNAKGARYEDGYFKLPANTDEFTYTVETKGNYKVSSVKIKDKNNGTKEVTFTSSTLNKTKDGLIYTFTGQKTADYANSELNVETNSVTCTLTVSTDGIDADKLLVKSNGRAIAANDDDEDEYKYEVEPFTTVTVQAVGEDSSYKLIGASVNGETAALSKNGEVNIFIADKEDNTVKFITEGVPAIYVQKYEDSGYGEAVFTPSKSKITSASTDKFKITLKYEGKLCEINNPVATNAEKGFLKLDSSNKKELIIDASKAADNGGKSVTLTFDAEGIAEQNLTFNVAQTVTKIKVDGFKYDNENSKWSVEQTAGTTARYKLTLTPTTGDYSRLEVKSPTVGNASATIVEEKGNHYLKVSTYGSNRLADSEVMFIIDDKGNNTGQDGIIMDGTVVVKPQNPALSVPNIKLSASTDIDMTFALTPDKKLSDVKNLYYVVTAEAADDDGDTALKRSITAYAAADAASIKLNLGEEGKTYGDGYARRYKVSAYLVQVKDYTGDAATDINDDNVIVSGEKINKVKTLINQSTKNPYYETKLGLNKKNTTITIGQKKVLLATAKYSSNTTFMQLDKAELLDADGSLVAASYEYKIDDADAPGSKKIKLDDDGTITLEGCPKGMSPGKYTLNVYPKQPSGTYSKPATLAITFNAPIAGLTLGAPSKQLYKANGKAASIKVSAYYNSYKDSLGNSYKPANTKVTWSVSSDYEPLDKALKISNGTVTIAKDYVLSATDSDNKFTVKAKALDLGDSGEEGVMEFAVISDMIVPVSMTIGNIAGSTDRNPAGVISTELNGKEFKIYDKSNKEVDLSNVTVTVTPKDGLYIYRDGLTTVKARVTKLGTYTVKAVINDGGKKTLTQKFVVKADDLNETTPYIVSVIAKSTCGYSTGSLDFTDNEADVSGADLLSVYVEPNPKTSGALCEDPKAKVSYGNTAKKVSNVVYNDDSVVTLKPKAGQNTIELSITTKDRKLDSAKYKINIKHGNGTITPEKNGYSLMTNTVNLQTLEFPVTGVTPAENLMLYFTPNESAYSSSKNYWPVEDVCWYLNNSGKVTLGDNVAELKLDSMWANKGTYNLYVSLWSTKTGTGEETVPDEPLTAPAAVKITLSEPKKPSAALKDPGKVEINRAKDSTARLSFKTMKNATGLADFPGAVSVLNNNNNGVVNNFTDYFEAAADGQDIILKTKQKVPSTVGNQIIGWIRYYVIGEDGITQIECVEKITVTLKE